MNIWPRKSENSGYESGYETLCYKSPDALVSGFIKNNYLPIIQAIRDGDLVNPDVVGLPVEEVFIRWLDARSTDQILYLGYHQALAQGDWSAFSCAQFTATRLAYQHDTRAYLQNWSSFDGPWGTGYDRCSFAIPAINAVAACDFALAKAYLPREDGLTVQGHAPLINIANLLMCLLYKEDAWIPSVLVKAEKAVGTKSLSILERAILACLIAILRHDPKAVSEHLQAGIDGFRKAGWLHDYAHPLSKFCPRIIYGLYFAARHYLTTEEFARVRQPDHFLWQPNYVAYCASQGFAVGKNLIDWRDELAFIHDELQDLERWKSFPCTQMGE